MKNRNTIFTTILLLIGCFAFLPAPNAFGVSPAPDGGYPGGNTAEGQAALLSLTTGGFNTAVGFLSLRSESTSGFNTAIGAGTLLANTADQNTATGAGALLSNTTGHENTATGAFALFKNTTGGTNTAEGRDALFNNTTGVANTATGLDALFSNIDGVSNTANGFNALVNNTTGSSNTAAGFGALQANTTGGFNTALGADAGTGVTTASNVICIGAAGANASNSCYIGQIFGATSPSGIAVFINSDGKLGTATSSQRFKEDIRPMNNASDTLFSLKPVTFRYKQDIDPDRRGQFGLVAEDVEKINPDLVVRDKEGKPYSVRYDQVTAMLLNEFLKQHCKVEEQQATIAELKSALAQQQNDFQATAANQQKQIESLSARLQKVTAQLAGASPSGSGLELSKFAPQTVLNNQ